MVGWDDGAATEHVLRGEQGTHRLLSGRMHMSSNASCEGCWLPASL